jgi:hypothetical protein
VLKLKTEKGKNDREVLALSQNKRFWRMFDAAYERGKKEGWIKLDDLE